MTGCVDADIWAHFYRPVAWHAGGWTFAVYSHYNRGHFYNDRPKVYVNNGRGHNAGRSSSARLLPTGRKKAKQGSWRISEATLLILAVIGGSIGALLGMKVWRHKTMHKGGVRDVDNIVEGTSSNTDFR